MHTFGYTNVSSGDSTQLLYLRSRFYAGNMGRFLTRDTWGGDANSPMSFNRWNYTSANPINRVDPSGHCFGGSWWDLFNTQPYIGWCSSSTGQSIIPVTPTLQAIVIAIACATPSPASTNSPTSTATPMSTITPIPTATLTIEQTVFSFYGVEIINGNKTWDTTNVNIALTAVSDIANRMGSADTFRLRFRSSSATPMRLIMGTSAPDINLSTECQGISGYKGCTTNSHTINFSGLSPYNGGLTARNNIVHELGHAFNGGRNGTPMADLGKQENGDYVSKRALILAPNVAEMWQLHIDNTSESETFADFFVAWTYNKWQPPTNADGLAGRAASWMNDSMTNNSWQP